MLPRELAAVAALVAGACGSQPPRPPLALSNAGNVAAEDDSSCRGSGYVDLRADGRTYELYLFVCESGTQRTAKLVLKSQNPPMRSSEIIDTWTADADDNETYSLQAVIEGPTGNDVALVIHEARDGRNIATAWARRDRHWTTQVVEEAAHMRADPRSNYANVTICSTLKRDRCIGERVEWWTWDGMKIQRRPSPY